MLLLHASWYGFKGQAQYCGNISTPKDQKPEDFCLLKDSATFLPADRGCGGAAYTSRRQTRARRVRSSPAALPATCEPRPPPRERPASPGLGGGAGRGTGEAEVAAPRAGGAPVGRAPKPREVAASKYPAVLVKRGASSCGTLDCKRPFRRTGALAWGRACCRSPCFGFWRFAHLNFGLLLLKIGYAINNSDVIFSNNSNMEIP